MKLAVVIAVGYLDRMGYQYHTALTLPTWAAAADRLYVVCSIPDQELPALPGITVLDGPAYWFKQVNGDWRYELRRVQANWAAGADQARADGYDVVYAASVTGYLTHAARIVLRRQAKQLLDQDNAWGWVYRRMQRGHTLYHAHVRDPLLLNLHTDARYSITRADSIENGPQIVTRHYGDFRAENNGAVIDIGLELSEPDLREKMIFCRNLHEWSTKRPAGYTWDYWRAYYQHKFGALPASEDTLDAVGSAVAARSRPDFVGALIDQEQTNS